VEARRSRSTAPLLRGNGLNPTLFLSEKTVYLFNDLQQIIRIFFDDGPLAECPPSFFCLSLHTPRNLVLGICYARFVAA